MGCTSSKKQVCRSCRGPMRRSNTIQVYHPPERDGDTYHLVALTSTTLGSLSLDPVDQIQNHHRQKSKEQLQQEQGEPIIPSKKPHDGSRRSSGISFSMGLMEAKTWSDLIDERIPKMGPGKAALPEPETINLWELMEGLEDVDPVRNSRHVRSFTFDVAPDYPIDFSDSPTEPLLPKDKPSMWLDLIEVERNSNAIISEFDPDVISMFKKALEDLPGKNGFEKTGSKEDRAVLYFTSLRGVRKTYEDCCHARVILKGTGVRVDERDVSMHSGFKEELKELLGGERFSGGGLPRVFVGRKYIGGVEEIRRLHEEGQLEKVLEGCERADRGGGGGGGVCDACGDIRFVPCETCSGSCKIFYEEDYDDEECEEGECGFQRCPDCNENGLTRCPICCD